MFLPFNYWHIYNWQKHFKYKVTKFVFSELHTSTITTCNFDIKDSRVISTSMDKTCKFWDLKSGVNTVTLYGHENIIADVASTENGQLVATCGWDKMIYLWDITTGMYRSQGPTALDKLHEGSISSVAFSRDGEYLGYSGLLLFTCV